MERLVLSSVSKGRNVECGADLRGDRLRNPYHDLRPLDLLSTPFLLLAAIFLFRQRRPPRSNLMYQCEIRGRRGHQKTMERTREGPDVFPSTSLPNRTDVDGGGHGAEGKDKRNKSGGVAAL
jgi:hypothetical protein